MSSLPTRWLLPILSPMFLFVACGKKEAAPPRPVAVKPAVMPSISPVSPLPIMEPPSVSEAAKADEQAAMAQAVERQRQGQALCQSSEQAFAQTLAMQTAAEAAYQAQVAAQAAAYAKIMQNPDLTMEQQAEQTATVDRQTPKQPVFTSDLEATQAFDALSFKFRAAAANHRDEEALAILKQMTELAPKAHSGGVKIFLAEARLTYAAPPQDTPLSPISGDLSQDGLAQPVSQ